MRAIPSQRWFAGFLAGRAVLALAGTLLFSVLSGFDATAQTDPLARLRSAALDDLFVLRDYRAGKNSFVESPERHVGAWTNQGFRYTLADLKGQGSLRHIWTTRGEGAPYFQWEFFVDGESAPSIRATDEELVAGSGRFPVPVAPANFIPVHNRAFNFFLPVPFEQEPAHRCGATAPVLSALVLPDGLPTQRCFVARARASPQLERART